MSDFIVFDCIPHNAAYIELAQRLTCPIVTADKKLYEKFGSIKTAALL